MSRRIVTPRLRAFYLRRKKLVLKSFREVFYKYVKPGRGTDLNWRMRRRKHVMRRIRSMLSYFSSGVDVYKLSDQEIFERLLRQYGRLVNHYKGRYYDEFIMYKYGEIDLG